MLEAGVAKHRFTVEEFRKMGEAGIFAEDDRVAARGVGQRPHRRAG